ncbi:eIF3 subunit 6 N terminal domain-domain-containing protein [Protomyces lactucae-debilis]|uniref:Eukaryotic translation initiation factor 3 subunit E n=1 Tax=Protomyces lactucae-debilis TaxID=2754530 RepID=A0A1Y2FLQ4_PROLT|nr:eIF3 subunit 6 N terminal domain-containing protein [Protomyces lactucae-debilis]ORY84507.1 eIF3 subunit 6 N terminal domain-domain-containing protein [Protomyces lactucae-debilis]
MEDLPVLAYLDRHLIYPVLDFLQQTGTYTEAEITQAKYDLLKDTNMPGHCAELYKQIHKTDEAPQEFAEKEEAIGQQLNVLESESKKVLEVLENPEVATALRQDKAQNMTFLRDNHDISIEQINVLYKLGQFDYNRGNYVGAVDHLYHFRVLSTDQKLVTSATWGKLASEILTANWEDALSELTKLREYIDGENDDPIAQLRSRTWLLHWALFPLHNAESPKHNELQELFFTPAYMNALQTSAPHLLRYLTVAVIAAGSPKAGNYNRRLRDLIRALEAEKVYSDPFTKFALALYSKYDFEGASNLLNQLGQIAASDYFLSSSAEAVTSSFTVAFIEAYFRLHKTADLTTLTRLTHLTEEALVSIINSSLEHLNADIDTEDGFIEIIRDVSGAQHLHDVIQRTKNLVERTGTLQYAMHKKLAA